MNLTITIVSALSLTAIAAVFGLAIYRWRQVFGHKKSKPSDIVVRSDVIHDAMYVRNPSGANLGAKTHTVPAEETQVKEGKRLLEKHYKNLDMLFGR